MKAKYIGMVRDRNGYTVHLFYEYRGHEYMVTDNHNGCHAPLADQHRFEQDRIDKAIEEERKERTGEHFDLSVIDVLYE